MVATAGLTVFPYMMYQKYLTDKDKAELIAIATPIGSLVMLAPILYYRKFTKKLLKSIAYDIPQNKFVFQQFSNKKPV